MIPHDEIPNDCDRVTHSVAAYWLSIHPKPDVLPSRHDFDPLDLPPDIWPNLMLTNVLREPLDLVYRLVGTEAAAILGLDVTGMKLSERPVRRDREAILDDYRVAIEDRVPRFRRFNVFDARRGFKVNMERLHLPMATDGRTVDMVLTSLVQLEMDRGALDELNTTRLCV
ncbi:MAG: hypothetical protein CMM59_06255 [Rhodospirillaceae bacterium]|nr:hypothetical protein [Rhodospirillaceae bacterium]